MNPELKKILDEIQTAFAEFKTANDERLKQIEAKGSADPLLEQKVDVANADITKLTAQLKAVETVQARVANAGGEDVRESFVANAIKFFAHLRGEPIDTVSSADLDQYRSYRKALNAYLRRGPSISSEFQNALQVGSAPDGGYFVTPDIGGKIVELLYLTSPVRQLASSQPIGTDTLEGYNDLDEADSGWVSETGARPETSTPKVGKWSIPVHEQYANPRITQKMLDDSNFDVETWLAKKVAAKLSRRENTAFVVGNGAGKPRGFMTYAAGTPTATAWNKIRQINSGAAGGFHATLPGDYLIDLIAALKQEYRSGGTFVMNSLTAAAARKLKDGQNNYLFVPDFSKGAAGTILGQPIVEMADMADIAADSLSIAYGNFAEAYQIVDHTVGIRVLRDPYTAKPYVQFYTTKRVGGDVVNFDAIKIMKFAA